VSSDFFEKSGGSAVVSKSGPIAESPAMAQFNDRMRANFLRKQIEF